ncbi:hypothetical protein VIS19158_05383 [Vibrio scophthalmi LMG 19158]|uniref:Uncharacterized protein n=1 Tax=Vibrio scophthalmi LMG 19158 TaxID=870967 RepID=F9RLH1_9VIBR|nr:hypothetical protein VIS19158_05383 [Vibrio scophthalmi LMG 19158]
MERGLVQKVYQRICFVVLATLSSDWKEREAKSRIEKREKESRGEKEKREARKS